MRKQIFLGYAVLLVVLSACTGTRRLKTVELPVTVAENETFQRAFSGFLLYDPATKQTIYEQNADRLFTPASNTKILTFYAASRLLPAQIPTLNYLEQGDSLIFWGTGDPSTLHPWLPDNGVVEWLRNRPERTLLYCPGNYRDDRYGLGWMWDDYGYAYQPEKAALPLYGNLARFERRPGAVGFFVEPNLFANLTVLNTKIGGTEPVVVRREFDNIFEYNPRALSGGTFDEYLPYIHSPELATTLLGDTVGREVRLLPLELVPPPDVQQYLGLDANVLYRELMQESDNFIAEQLLLLISGEYFGTLNTADAIDFVTDSLYSNLPQPIRWVDGSGLSRYNLISPRDLVTVLDRLYFSMPQTELFDIFPAGGRSGTLRNWYAGEDGQPYVYAKTGTLSGVHCLSGYLLTKRGKVLIFSFMHNNYTGSSRDYKEAMQTVLEEIRDTY